jgi:rhodanese-related sulfurtransferase
MRHLSFEGLAPFLREHPGTRVLDVRLAPERDGEHLRDELAVSWYTPDWVPDPDFLGQVLQRLARDDYVVVVCARGDLSFDAAAFLEQAGFRHVYTILGGYEDVRRARRTGVSRDGRGMRFRVRRTLP